MDLDLLSFHRNTYNECYKSAVIAMQNGEIEKAIKYAELAKASASHIIEHTSNAEERKRYKAKREKCDILIVDNNSITADSDEVSVENDDKDENTDTEKNTEKKSSVAVLKPKRVPLEEALKELDELEGQEELKQQMHNLVKQIKAFQLRKLRGIKIPEISYHMVFVGNPGSGKTTVARIIAQIFLALGIIKKGQFVEVARSDLVAAYVGQTALKTQDVIKRAMGGVLFIDEAYALTNGSSNDFGQEAIDTLIKEMEDHRDQFIVIVAGYEDLMKRFIESNPGLRSRFKNYIRFSDYTPEQLMNIFSRLCEKNQYTISNNVQEKLVEYFDDLYRHRNKNFGNGRTVRNLFEKIITKQSVRVAEISNPDNEQITEIKEEDLTLDD